MCLWNSLLVILATMGMTGVTLAEPNTINGVKTVFIIMMENHDWSTIKGNLNCPYLNNTLLPLASFCEQYHTPPALHPSEPNYLWLVAGTNFGIRNDDAPAINHLDSTNTLFHQLDRAGISWKTYQENITGDYVPDTNNYPYAVRHDPFVFFDSVRNNPAYCTSHVRPYGELAQDLANGTVARFNFITPNVTNDMHDRVQGCSGCSTRIQGDYWLSHEVPSILASPAYTNGGALFITFDEGAGTSDGPIAMIVLSPRARGGGYSNSLFYDHSSTVRTLQDIFGLRPYLGAAARATNLSDLFKTIQITAASWNGTQFTLMATNVIPGHTNHLQMSTNLVTTNWTTLKTNVPATTWQIYVDDTAGASHQRFYRVVEEP
jgi:phosphatidylinositol-3-phosphatase